jgi:peptide/nickel transport system substrate-binding protein
MNLKEFRLLLRRRFHLPKERAVRRATEHFTPAERATFTFFASLFVVAGLSLLWHVSDAYLVEVPARGGTLAEGVVGNPRFINPVLALSEADKNLTALVYSGLVKFSPEGRIENDLADSIEVSSDLLTYTVRLKDDAHFHDGKPVTADDIVFTVSKVEDPLIKSPRRGNWEGVSVSKVDEKTVAFALKKPYAPFIYNLTLGILPRHIWKNVTADEFSFSQWNTLPVGSGPYKIARVERNEGGIPDYYELVPFADSVGREPYIGKLVFSFYPSEDALIEAYNHGDIESLSGLSPDILPSLEAADRTVLHSPLPRIFAAFFNQSHSKVLADASVREALSLAAPRKEIVREVFGGYATAIDSPLPAGLYPWTAYDLSAHDAEADLAAAKELLAKAGWAMGESGALEKKSGKDTMALSFSISTGDAPELKAVAEKLATAWAALGAKVDILVFETGELNQNVIRPRNFDALLFGEMVGKDADLYPFWHSSQRTDPGLNIALYANAKVDRLLEDARRASSTEGVEADYAALAAEMKKDVPAAFLYTPSFLYVVPKKVQAVAATPLLSSQDRFAGVKDWYVETDKVWKAFIANASEADF